MQQSCRPPLRKVCVQGLCCSCLSMAHDAASAGATTHARNQENNMDERERWNARYAGRAGLVAAEPNPFLQEHLALLPRSHALELAMGEGHNAIFLAQQGFSVTGIDISEI